MKVLHVDTGRDWRGGQRQVLLAATGMAARGVDVTIASRPGSALLARAAAAGIPVLEAGFAGEANPLSALALARLARRTGADLVHAHCAHSHGAALVAGVFGRRWRLVVTRRSARTAPPRPGSALKYRWGVDRYIAISEAVRQALLMVGAPPERVRVVPSGVPVPGAVTPEDWRRRLGLPADSFVIGSAGALTGEKGHRDLVDALASAGDERLHLVLIGSGPRAGELREAARAANVLHRVHLVGFIDDVASAVAGLDLYVQPSHSEALGTAVLDAMALGRPVVATRVGGLSEVVQPDVSGVLVPPRWPDGLARAILRLFHDPALRERLAAGARARAADYSADAMVEGTLAVYHELR